jgi:hypothetical protein
MRGSGTGGSPQRETSTQELLDAAGIVVTDEGKRQARKKLDAGRAVWTRERWFAFWEQLGVPPEDRTS